jgi:hypothetical protein
MRVHWLIIDDTIVAGQQTIAFNTVAGLVEGEKVTIGPWLGVGSSKFETLYINKVFEDLNTISVCQDSSLKINGTKYLHLKYETISGQIC